MKSITLKSPAKINLGLAITGRRPDGFHDLVTIFQAIDLTDTLEVTVAEEHVREGCLSFQCDAIEIDPLDNLVVKAVRAIRLASGTTASLAIRLTKRIPIAAGLGGASSNAATTLVALDSLLCLGLPMETLESLALGLGSDVPFFLRGGCALGRGRGEILQSLPCPVAWVVLVFPTGMMLPTRKTAALFSTLAPGDFNDGSDVFNQGLRLQQGESVDTTLLGNSFVRPLDQLAPSVADLRSRFRSAGAHSVALSGAGPTHYTIVDSREEADRIARAYVSTGHTLDSVFVCRTMTST